MRPGARALQGAAILLGMLAGGCSRAPSLLDRSAMAEIGAPGGVDQLDTSVRAAMEQRRQRIEQLWASSASTAADLAEAHGSLGHLHQAYNHLAPAIACYENAAKLQPEESRWPYFAAHCYRRRGDIALARQAFRRSLDLDPRVATQVWLADLELVDGNIAEAEKLVAAAMEADPGCLRARFILGRVELASGDYRAAIPLFELVRERLPALAEVRHPLGLAHRAAGDLERAEIELAASLQGERSRPAQESKLPPCGDEPLLELRSVSPGSKAHAIVGERLFASGRFQEAAASFRKAVEEEPDRPEPRLNLALALHRSGENQAAIEQCDAILRLDPSHVEAYFGRAVAREGLGQRAAAEGDYSSAIDLNPDHRKAHWRLGALLHARGAHADALLHYRRHAELDPASSESRLWVVVELAQLDRHSEALAACEKDVDELRGSPVHAVMLARLLAASPEAGRRDGARARSLVGAEPVVETALFHAETLAMVHAELGGFEHAEAWQRSCLAAAQKAGAADAVGWVRRRLDRYEQRRPARMAWEPDERMLDVRVQPPS